MSKLFCCNSDVFSWHCSIARNPESAYAMPTVSCWVIPRIAEEQRQMYGYNDLTLSDVAKGTATSAYHFGWSFCYTAEMPPPNTFAEEGCHAYHSWPSTSGHKWSPAPDMDICHTADDGKFL